MRQERKAEYFPQYHQTTHIGEHFATPAKPRRQKQKQKRGFSFRNLFKTGAIK
jgi:hypothetical protein